MSPPPAHDRFRVTPHVGCVAIFVAVFLAYLPAFGAGFVWNDSDYVTAPALQSLHGLWRIWFEVGATEQYYPLLHSAFWLEHRLWGDAAIGYHLLNAILHVGAACLVALVLLRLAVPGAWLAGLIFALHPVHAESVAWISEQKNTLSTVFYLGAALVYFGFDASRTRRDYLISFVLFACAILAKSVAATLPAALLVVLWWKRGALDWRRDIVPLLPWLILGAAWGLFSSWVERNVIGADGANFALDGVQRTLLAGRVAWFYASKLVWPVNLMFIYPRWKIDPAAWSAWVFPFAAAALVIALWMLRRRSRGPLAAVLLFGGTLFPVLGFFNVYAFLFSYVADHFQYLPSLGLIALGAAGFARGFDAGSQRARQIAVALLVAASLGLGAQTWRQCATYHDAITFYTTILERNPACWMAHNNLASELASRGQWDAAIAHYESALRLRPAYFEAHNNLASLLADRGQFVDANAHFAQAVRLKPDSATTQANWGTALMKQGDTKTAASHFVAALNLDPSSPTCHYDLGVALASLGQTSQAILHYERALAQKPDYAEAHYNWGVALQGLEQWPEATFHFAEAVRLKPDYVEACNNLGVALRKSQRPAEAVLQFEQALRLKPELVEAHFNLALALEDLGKLAPAIAQFEEAAKLRPQLAEAHYQLALALRTVGRIDEAKARYAEARRLKPSLPAIDF